MLCQSFEVGGQDSSAITHEDFGTVDVFLIGNSSYIYTHVYNVTHNMCCLFTH